MGRAWIGQLVLINIKVYVFFALPKHEGNRVGNGRKGKDALLTFSDSAEHTKINALVSSAHRAQSLTVKGDSILCTVLL